jgi:GT2 family glycosyltransferase
MDVIEQARLATEAGAPGGLWQPAPGEPGLVRGWVLPDPLEPEGTPEVMLEISGLGPRMVAAGDLADAALGLPRGARLFAWHCPAGLAGSCRIRAWHLGSGAELDGSPLSLELPALPPAPAGQEAEARLLRWPGALAGHVAAAAPVELAADLWVQAQPPAVTLRYELHVQAGRGAEPPGRGVRLVSDAASVIRIHMLPPAPLPVPGEETEVTVTAWLPEATENAMQAHGEIWLTRRDGADFVPLRRLRRMRLFRRQGVIRAGLTLTEEETALAGRLWVTVAALDARGLSAMPPRIARAADPADRMEDGRLQGSFEELRRAMRLHGAPEAEARLLPPSEGAGTVPAAPALPWHPFTQVVVPVYNGDAVVLDCLRALRRAATGPMQVLVVDDGSRALTSEALRTEVAADPRFILHRRDINRGYTKSINEAVLLTRADWVVILNSDTLVPQGWLDRLHAAIRARPGAGMAGPLSNAATWQSVPEVKRPEGGWSTNDDILPEELERMQALLAEASERAYPEFPVLNGFCTLIARAVFDEIGLYDEDAFPMGYGEETDLCLRARRAGFRLVVADDCFVYHHKSVSFGAGRSRLTRAGGYELRNKHMGATIAAMEHAMASCTPMQRLRARLADVLGAGR